MGTFVLRITGVVVAALETLDGPQQAVALVPNLVDLMGNSQVPESPILHDVSGRFLKDQPHMAFLRYPSASSEPIHPPPGILPPPSILRYLNRHRVSFTFVGEPDPVPMQVNSTADAPGRQWQTYATAALVTSALKEDLSNLANITDITGRHIDSAHLSTTPGSEVLAQVMIGGVGRLFALPPENNLRWEMRSLVNAGVITRPVSHALLWEVNGVDEVEVRFDPLDPVEGEAESDVGSSFRLAIPEEGQTVMTLASLCVQNPLEWTVEYETVVDEDLLWSFALLENLTGIATEVTAAGIQPEDLAPHPVVSGGGGSSGANCRDPIAIARRGEVARLFDLVGS